MKAKLIQELQRPSFKQLFDAFHFIEDPNSMEIFLVPKKVDKLLNFDRQNLPGVNQKKRVLESLRQSQGPRTSESKFAVWSLALTSVPIELAPDVRELKFMKTSPGRECVRSESLSTRFLDTW